MYYKIRLVDRDWRVNDTFICTAEQLPVIESFGATADKSEITKEEFDELKNVEGIRDYDSFIESFGSFPRVSNKLREIEGK